MDEVTAIQSAAGGNREDIVRLLMQRGASLTIRDPFYDGTPIGWADFYDHPHLRNILLSEGDISLFDALDHDRLDRVPDILARDSAAVNRPFAECLSRDPKPQDWQTPLVRMVDQGKTETVRVLLNHGADISARNFDGQSLVQLARDKGFEEIADHLEQHVEWHELTGLTEYFVLLRYWGVSHVCHFERSRETCCVGARYSKTAVPRLQLAIRTAAAEPPLRMTAALICADPRKTRVYAPLLTAFPKFSP